MALFLSNCGRLGKGEETESAIHRDIVIGEEAENAIWLELVIEPIGSGARYRGWTPRFHGICAGTVPLLGQFFKLVVI